MHCEKTLKTYGWWPVPTEKNSANDKLKYRTLKLFAAASDFDVSTIKNH